MSRRYKNVDMADTTGLPNIADSRQETSYTVRARVVRLDTSVPAHQALKQVVAMKAGDGNNNQLETDMAECRGACTSWGAVATDHSCLRVTMMMMMMMI